MKICYSAPAKIIISGEHAVVYGKPALISAVNLRLTFTVWPAIKSIEDKVMPIITEHVKKYLKKRNVQFIDKQFKYSIQSDIPIGQNLGSSAALSVASSGALLEFFAEREFSKDEINSCAYEIEKYFHGKPSGGDNSASCFGGLIYFRKEFEFLKNISSLNIKIPKKINDSLYIIDSGRASETTAELVRNVGEMYNKKPKLIEDILNRIEKVTKRIVVSIAQENIMFFKQSIVENEELLEELNIVSKKTKKLLINLKNFGAGKVTGAGGFKTGSGNILFLADNPKILETHLNKKSISFIKFKQDFEGVKKIK